VKLRSGLEPGGREGVELALRLADEAGVAAIGFHPRSARRQHKGEPDYALARELVELSKVPVIISGGLDTAEDARHAYRASGADAVMIARGSLGNPWIFEELTGTRAEPPEREEIVAELLWVMERAEEHLGAERAARYLRKFYPWYLERLEADRATTAAFQQSEDLDRARQLVELLEPPVAAAL
jgi:tRNA-dihydrouridine synthase